MSKSNNLDNLKHKISPHKNDSKKIKLSPYKAQLMEEKKENFINYFTDDEDFFNLDTSTATETTQPTLELQNWQTCIVQDIGRHEKSFDLILNLKSIDTEHWSRCHLQTPWSHTRLSVGDKVSILAIWDETLNAYKVNKDQGFCITNPDRLISGTSVVASLFCSRKAALQQRFAGIDANNKVMVIGTLVHELFQNVLKQQLNTLAKIKKAADELLNAMETSKILFDNCLQRNEVETEVKSFIPNLYAFVQQYLLQQGTEQSKNFQGVITSVQDIEENLWVPRLGLKGKVDVTLHVRRKQQQKQELMPLELKTGRASFSMEHKGQILLYQMMLRAVGRQTGGGLLLYLREGVMREVSLQQHNEQRDLIMLRNELCHYLWQVGDGMALNLPEPISHHSACGNCAYATICCTFAQNDEQTELSEKHPLRQVMKNVLSHLESEDFEYFMKWCNIVMCEELEARAEHTTYSFWTQTGQERETKGIAILGLKLLPNTLESNSRYINTFSAENKDLTKLEFSKGEYVIVSSEQRLAIAAGCIESIQPHQISINLERDLLQNYSNQTFIIDKHESYSQQVFNYTTIGLLLDDTAQAHQLRRIIIHAQQPNYAKELPRLIATQGKEIMQPLNNAQRAALLKALTTDSYMLIKGLPGTGKTQTLMALVRLLVLLGKKVLITSHTHSAVDNLLLRLLPHKLSLLRLGSGQRIHKDLQHCSEQQALKDCQNEADLALRYASFSVVGVTCLGTAHSIFHHCKFDFCIVDEASQILQPIAIRPLFFAEKFVLVGDADQLPPLVRSEKARLQGGQQSLFELLDGKQATSVLDLQYRMNQTITKLANNLMYRGALKCATTEVKNAMLELKDLAGKEAWLQRTLTGGLESAVIALDTLYCGERIQQFATANGIKSVDSRNTNFCEAAVVYCLLSNLLKAGCHGRNIGVIAAYRSQVELLNGIKVRHDWDDIEINTVDQYQGRDKQVVIFSAARSDKPGKATSGQQDNHILNDKRRLNVAITRAKHKLILVGDLSCLQQYKPFNHLLKYVPKSCKITLEDGNLNFDWNTIMTELAKNIITEGGKSQNLI